MQKDVIVRDRPPNVSDPNWRGMFRVGGITFTFLGILFVVALSGVIFLGTIPSASVSDGLIYVDSHVSTYLIAYGSLFAAGFLLFPSVFSIFLALKYTNRTWASIGLGTMAVGIPLFILTAVQALTVLSLANSYASTSNDLTQSTAILGAGLSSLTTMGVLQKTTYLVFAMGSVVNGAISVRSEYIGRVVGGLVLGGSFFIILGIIFVVALAPAILLFAAAFIITGWKLCAISKKSVPL
jgi:hypothetical protein